MSTFFFYQLALYLKVMIECLHSLMLQDSLYYDGCITLQLGCCQLCVRVIFVKSESQAVRVRVDSESFKFFSSQSHDLVESSHKNWRVASSQWFASSNQCRVTRNFTFFLRHFFAMKWCPTCHKMAPDKLENGGQCCFHKFDYRLFISKFSQFTFYLSLSLSVISKSLFQPCCKCYSLSVSVVVSVATLLWRKKQNLTWKKTENNIKKQTYKIFKKVKTKLEMYANANGTCT